MSKIIHRRQNNAAASILERMKPLGMTLEGGVVKAVGTGTVTFELDGVEVPNIPVIGGDPSVGDQLWALRTGTTLLALNPGGGDFLPLAGGTLTGTLIFDGPTAPQSGSIRPYDVASRELLIIEGGDGISTDSRLHIYGAGDATFPGVVAAYLQAGKAFEWRDLTGGLMADIFHNGTETDFHLFGFMEIDNEIRLGDGTDTDPSYTFINDPDTGILLYADAIVGITNAGDVHHRFAQFQHEFYSDVAGYTTLALAEGKGVRLMTSSMNTTSQYTPGVWFGTYDPEPGEADLAGIVGRAVATYSSSTSAPMVMDFFTTPVGVKVPALAATLSEDGEWRTKDGDAANPGHGFIDEPGVGMYRNTTDNLAFSTAATRAFMIGATQDMIWYQSGTTEIARFDVSVPSLEFTAGSRIDFLGTAGTTDMYWGGVDRHSDGVSGSLRLDSGNSYHLFQHTSSIRYKEDVTPITAAEAWAMLGAVDAITYQSKPRTHKGPIDPETGEIGPDVVISGKRSGGFIAETVHVAEQRPDTPNARFVALDKDGIPDALGMDGLVAVLWAAVEDLGSRVTDLETVAIR
jgi:hypothetical protein